MTASASSESVLATSPSRGVFIGRVALIVFGAALTLLGAYVMMTTVKPKNIVGVITWLIGALILHDGIISPIVVGIGIGLKRVGRRIPASVLWIVQGAVFVGSVFTLVVVPEIIRKAKIPKNYTVLPFDYAPRLAILWGVIVVLTAVVIVVVLRVRRRSPVDHTPAA
ncbi:hypothetical protein [Frondihabitans cladoniiphilus]|uniref:Uncharacterized protein n=1 Tax=Frondihabitans cladoniiphilus TaxID=715785 RepID=A0ABP8VSM0_9MICO